MMLHAASVAYEQIAKFQTLLSTDLLRYNLRFKAEVDVPQENQPNGLWTIRLSVRNRESWEHATVRFQEGIQGSGQSRQSVWELTTRVICSLIDTMRFAGLIDHIDADAMQEAIKNPKKAEG